VKRWGVVRYLALAGLRPFSGDLIHLGWIRRRLYVGKVWVHWTPALPVATGIRLVRASSRPDAGSPYINLRPLPALLPAIY